LNSNAIALGKIFRAIAFSVKSPARWETFLEKREKLCTNPRFVGFKRRKSDLKDPDVGKIIRM